MPELTIDIADETPCETCGTSVPVAIDACPNCQANTHRLPFDEFFSELDRLRLMDARYGGLVLGRDGPEDDIPMYLFQRNAVFMLAGLMQGGEYIMSQAAGAEHHELLKTLNSARGDFRDLDFKLTSASSVINTNFLPPYGGLWIKRGQFVINRYATRLHFETLERLNSEANQKYANSIAFERTESEENPSSLV